MVDNPQRVLNVRPYMLQGMHLLIQRDQTYDVGEVGLRIWQLCDGQHSVPEIAQVIVEEYSKSYDEVLADCDEFVGSLKVQGLLQ